MLCECEQSTVELQSSWGIVYEYIVQKWVPLRNRLLCLFTRNGEDSSRSYSTHHTFNFPQKTPVLQCPLETNFSMQEIFHSE